MGSENIIDINIKELIKNSGNFKGKDNLVRKTIDIFDFTQFLLDDDKNLTKIGNLTSSAREELRKRINELFLTQDE